MHTLLSSAALDVVPSMDEWDVVPPLAISSGLIVAADTDNVVASQPVRVGVVFANFGQRYIVFAHDVAAVPSDHLVVLDMPDRKSVV